MTYNPTKLRLMLQQVKRWNNRVALLRKNARLNCRLHALQPVKDFLAQEAVLACGCSRSVELPFIEAEKQELIAFLSSPGGRRKQVSGHNRNSVTYVEDLPKEAA